jgi:HJR/Mrr/RecB family endonuclease
MVNCAKCGEKLGLFQAKFDYEDEKGNSIKYCSKCNCEYQKKEKEKKVKILEKQKIEEEKIQEKNLNEISEICKKYLSTKDFDFKGIILGVYKHKDLYKLVEKDDLDFLKEHFVKLYQQSQETRPSNSNEYDEAVSMENTCNSAWQYIQDLEKIKKVLEKREIKSDYIKLIKLMADFVNEDLKKTMEKITLPAYKRISKITKDKKQIIKEYLKLGFDTPNEMIIEDLFDKFGLSYSGEEVTKLLNQCIEDAELDDFEENLGTKQHKQIGDFDSLNGHQFEDYLKELFSALEYQVIRTKLSGDQGADLIIKKDEQKTVVQAKKYSGDVTNKAIQEVVASKEHYGASKAMVVTTGMFTKSAIELAKSNKVELWDKNRLNEIISSINKSSNKNKGFKTEQSASLEDNHFPTFCPFCESKIKLKVDELPKMNKQKTMSCPECNVDLGISIPEKFYSCVGCKKEFETVKERIEHSKQCKKVKERQFNCLHCKKEFTLDDNELEEFTKKGTLKVECPVCKKGNVLKR